MVNSNIFKKKNYRSSKDTIKRIKRQVTEWKIFSTHIDNTGPLPEYINCKIKNSYKSVRKRQSGNLKK